MNDTCDQLFTRNLNAREIIVEGILPSESIRKPYPITTSRGSNKPRGPMKIQNFPMAVSGYSTISSLLILMFSCSNTIGH